MTVAIVDRGATTVDLLNRQAVATNTIFATVYVTNPRGWRYKGRHRAQPSIARIATGLIQATLVLSFAAIGALSMWVR